MFDLIFVIIGGFAVLLVGWFLFPAPVIVTNWWKRIFGQKELRQK